MTSEIFLVVLPTFHCAGSFTTGARCTRMKVHHWHPSIIGPCVGCATSTICQQLTFSTSLELSDSLKIFCVSNLVWIHKNFPGGESKPRTLKFNKSKELNIIKEAVNGLAAFCLYVTDATVSSLPPPPISAPGPYFNPQLNSCKRRRKRGKCQDIQVKIPLYTKKIKAELIKILQGKKSLIYQFNWLPTDQKEQWWCSG